MLYQFLQPQSSMWYFNWSLSTLFSLFLQGCMRMAPSKRITSPFNMGFSAIAVTRCANSAGSPRRDGKGTCLARKLCTFSGNPARSGVANRPVGKGETNRVKTMNYDRTWCLETKCLFWRCWPGAMVTTRIPIGARSRAIGSVIPTIPPLEAEYAACPTFKRQQNNL